MEELEETTFDDEKTRHAQHGKGAPRDESDVPAGRAELVREVERLEAACEAARNESAVYGRIAHALAQSCVELFYVNMETAEYVEYRTDGGLGSLTEWRRAADFFESRRREAELLVHEQDRIAFAAAMDRGFLSEALSRTGTFEMTYRRVKDGGHIYVSMRVSRVEDDGRFAVVAVTDVDELVRERLAEERMQEERLERMRFQANADDLTGVKNRHAYLEAEAHMDRQIAAQRVPPFAIVVLDVNDLKKVNDTAGHQAGDELLQGACRSICDIFKHSPVFRVGGDEFAVIAQGEDYEHLEERLAEMRDHNERALQRGGAVIACGTAFFRGETRMATVFERADRNMYEDKCRLKALGAK